MTKTSILMATTSIVLGFTFSPVQASNFRAADQVYVPVAGHIGNTDALANIQPVGPIQSGFSATPNSNVQPQMTLSSLPNPASVQFTAVGQIGAVQFPAASQQQNNNAPNFSAYYQAQIQTQLRAPTPGNFLMAARVRIVNAPAPAINTVASIPVPPVATTIPLVLPEPEMPEPQKMIELNAVGEYQVLLQNPWEASPNAAAPIINTVAGIPAPPIVATNPMILSPVPEAPCPPAIQPVVQIPLNASTPVINTVASIPVPSIVATNPLILSPVPEVPCPPGVSQPPSIGVFPAVNNPTIVKAQLMTRAPVAGTMMLAAGRRLISNNLGR